MKFIIKRYRVPIKITKDGNDLDKVEYVEVPMVDEILKDIEDTEIDSQIKISMEAKNIAQYNNTQLKMAEMDREITHVYKKIICKID